LQNENCKLQILFSPSRLTQLRRKLSWSLPATAAI
jgi:hypothetical protein